MRGVGCLYDKAFVTGIETALATFATGVLAGTAAAITLIGRLLWETVVTLIGSIDTGASAAVGLLLDPQPMIS